MSSFLRAVSAVNPPAPALHPASASAHPRDGASHSPLSPTAHCSLAVWQFFLTAADVGKERANCCVASRVVAGPDALPFLSASKDCPDAPLACAVPRSDVSRPLTADLQAKLAELNPYVNVALLDGSQIDEVGGTRHIVHCAC